MTTLKKIIGLVLVVTIFASTAVLLSSCKKEPEAEHTHTFYTPWMSDAENHWHAASCGHTDQKGELGAHKDKDYDNICDICGYNSNASNAVSTTTYIVYVKDASGAPVDNVKVILVSSDSYTAYKMSENGRVTFTIADGDWKAALESDPTTTYAFDENNRVTITVQ